MTAPFFPSPSNSAEQLDLRIELTINHVNWDALSSLGLKLFQAPSSHWGKQLSGAYNLVRFLHLHDSNNTILVARVPLCEDNSTSGHRFAISNRVESEVATMEYIEAFTKIPVPHILLHSLGADSADIRDVRSPFILMTYVDGVPLVSVWATMEDAKRRVILQQVVDILLELWSQRFEKRGALFKRKDGGSGRDAWYIDDSSLLADRNDSASRFRLPSTSYMSATHYWLAFANAYLQDICNEDFGLYGKEFDYCRVWFMRSIIPELFDPSIDTYGYPLCPGDFHSQNIMVTDLDSPSPKISAVIDWELSGSEFVSYFAWYPMFIQDHPLWEDDEPLRERNARDQATFDELLLAAESKRTKADSLPLSNLISKSHPVYLFCQAMNFPYTQPAFFGPLFAYIYGDDEDFEGDFYHALMDQGILKKETRQFQREHKALHEAREVLGKEVFGTKLTEASFRELVCSNLDKFDTEGSSVHAWLTEVKP